MIPTCNADSLLPRDGCLRAAAALTMGYQFKLLSATLSASRGGAEGQVEASVSVVVQQSGVAPFYYGLSLTLSLSRLPL